MTGGYSDDLSRFKQTYFDECSELLAVAEAGLLRLSPQNIDLDEINAVFRAVHSIKGGGGTFGFSDLVTFTHEFEAVMDRLRSQQIGVIPKPKNRDSWSGAGCHRPWGCDSVSQDSLYREQPQWHLCRSAET
jgi:HPt (histidine-containing phosphotransfer) domain-containing protein